MTGVSRAADKYGRMQPDVASVREFVLGMQAAQLKGAAAGLGALLFSSYFNRRR